MRVTVIGAGYVGLVTSGCFADVGNDVVCIDTDSKKIERLNHGEIPYANQVLMPSSLVTAQRAV